jgi:pyruvate dehydrogenase complex dehydrogenase (E1) component
MMNMDGARAGNGVTSFPSPKKYRVPHSDDSGGPTTNPGVGPTEPVFESQEKKLNIEVPEGWRSVES